MQESEGKAPADRVLIALLGLTPQVVTETLWCTATYDQWWPNRLVLITTEYGKAESIGLEERIKLLANGLHQTVPIVEWRELPIFDLRHEDDLIWLQSKLSAEVVKHRKSSLYAAGSDGTACLLHVSLAGGRRGMSAIAMQVMERWGRPSDALTQVLVSPAELEGAGVAPDFAQFWWPGEPPSTVYKYKPWLVDANEAASDPKEVECSKVNLDLVDIPFIALMNPTEQQTDLGRMYRIYKAACEKKFDVSVDRAAIRVCPVLADGRGLSVEVVLKADTDKPVESHLLLGRAVVNLQEFALLWWIVFETWRHRQGEQAGEAASVWRGVNRNSPAQLASLLRIVAWLEAGDGAEPSPKDDAVLQAVRGLGQGNSPVLATWAPDLLQFEDDRLKVGEMVNQRLSPVLSDLRKKLVAEVGDFAELLLGLKDRRLGASPRICIALPEGCKARFCGDSG